MNSIRLVILLILALSTNGAFAQCKFDKEKKDSFTGEDYRIASQRIGPRNYNWQLLLEQKGESYRLGMIIKWNGHIPNNISEGQSFLYLKLANGELVQVAADAMYSVSHAGVQGAAAIISTFKPFGNVTKEIITKLSASPIVALKAVYGGVETELPKIKEDQTVEIMNYAKCLIQ